MSLMKMVRGPIIGQTAPVHPTKRAREGQRIIGVRRGVETLVAIAFENHTTHQLIERGCAPHVLLGQMRRTDLRHANGERLFQGVFLARNGRRFDVDLFDLGQRLTSRTVEHKVLPGFGAKDQRRRAFEVDQRRLHRHVKVPQIVVHGLIDPFLVASGGIEGEDAGAVFLVFRRAFHPPEVDGGVADRHEHGVACRVIGHRRPDVRHGTRVGGAVGRRV